MQCDKVALILLGFCGIICCIHVDWSETEPSGPPKPVGPSEPLMPPDFKPKSPIASAPEWKFLKDGMNTSVVATWNYPNYTAEDRAFYQQLCGCCFSNISREKFFGSLYGVHSRKDQIGGGYRALLFLDGIEMVIDTVLAWKNHVHVTPGVKAVLERAKSLVLELKNKVSALRSEYENGKPTPDLAALIESYVKEHENDFKNVSWEVADDGMHLIYLLDITDVRLELARKFVNGGYNKTQALDKEVAKGKE